MVLQEGKRGGPSVGGDLDGKGFVGAAGGNQVALGVAVRREREEAWVVLSEAQPPILLGKGACEAASIGAVVALEEIEEDRCASGRCGLHGVAVRWVLRDGVNAHGVVGAVEDIDEAEAMIEVWDAVEQEQAVAARTGEGDGVVEHGGGDALHAAAWGC